MGVPLLRTVHGTGLMEGGSFCFLDSEHAAVGLSTRVNVEGARQVAEVLRVMGIELILVDLPGYQLHIDESLMMIDDHLALVDFRTLPYTFLERLKELKNETVDVEPGEERAVNCLTIRPGLIVMDAGTDRTAEKLRGRGIEVVQVDVSEILCNGGGIHCATLPLLRDPL